MTEPMKYRKQEGIDYFLDLCKNQISINFTYTPWEALTKQ